MVLYRYKHILAWCVLLLYSYQRSFMLCSGQNVITQDGFRTHSAFQVVVTLYMSTVLTYHSHTSPLQRAGIIANTALTPTSAYIDK